ncbi:hypothetical protein B0H63DRAFT_490369 [Podospora didyma]|uniref:Uncharacterized protein n=1 Tax=Podospora didyma TaxID=330526 RepID=A0AAE0JYP5_9PEZI|nr:hypothetical protein B0H63DRAFT_490369 [Podospora didyma]
MGNCPGYCLARPSRSPRHPIAAAIYLSYWLGDMGTSLIPDSVSLQNGRESHVFRGLLSYDGESGPQNASYQNYHSLSAMHEPLGWAWGYGEPRPQPPSPEQQRVTIHHFGVPTNAYYPCFSANAGNTAELCDMAANIHDGQSQQPPVGSTGPSVPVMITPKMEEWRGGKRKFGQNTAMEQTPTSLQPDTVRQPLLPSPDFFRHRRTPRSRQSDGAFDATDCNGHGNGTHPEASFSTMRQTSTASRLMTSSHDPTKNLQGSANSSATLSQDDRFIVLTPDDSTHLMTSVAASSKHTEIRRRHEVYIDQVTAAIREVLDREGLEQKGGLCLRVKETQH